uniref:Glycosyltransferase n=1 Tax=candidate division WOR-3 bacterium TaxID=2052148 RepID=A0A7V3UZP9_UNCW3
MNKPELSLIFVNYNSGKLVDRALRSFFNCEPEIAAEVIVVDNGSRDIGELREVCARYSARLLLLKRNRGYGAAANQGVQVAQGDFVAVANPDVEFLPGAVSQLVRFLRENERAGVVAPQLFYPDGMPQPSCRRLPRLRYVFAGRRSPLLRLFPHFAPAREFLYLDVWKRAEPVEVEAVIGTVMFFRRVAYQEVGGFDERYFMFAEDMDICERLQAHGWQVFLEPRARVVHYYGAVRRRWRRQTEYQRVRALHRFFTRRGGFFSSFVLTPAFAGYYFTLEALGLVGLGEFEYSWQKGKKGESV